MTTHLYAKPTWLNEDNIADLERSLNASGLGVQHVSLRSDGMVAVDSDLDPAALMAAAQPVKSALMQTDDGDRDAMTAYLALASPIGTDTDRANLTTYATLPAGTATLAQTQAALTALIRVVTRVSQAVEPLQRLIRVVGRFARQVR
jgi:hypothetical protein